MIDFLGDKHLVDTHVAIAFGASVQPFTKITPEINDVIINRLGLANSSLIKLENAIDISFFTNILDINQYTLSFIFS